jgi:hypothetical protein
VPRLEIELAHHGGNDNGKLPLTYDDIERYGVHRQAIAPALRELAALGFIEITERGRAGNGEFRRPHQFRLTYRNLARANPTNEWRKIETAEQASEIIRTVRVKTEHQWWKTSRTSGGKRTTNGHSPVVETTTTAIVRKPPLLSISGVHPPLPSLSSSPPSEMDHSPPPAPRRPSLPEGESRPVPHPPMPLDPEGFKVWLRSFGRPPGRPRKPHTEKEEEMVTERPPILRLHSPKPATQHDPAPPAPPPPRPPVTDLDIWVANSLAGRRPATRIREGYQLTPEHKAKLSAAWTPERRAHHREIMQARKAARLAGLNGHAP